MIERRSEVSTDEFFGRYSLGSRPVILTDVMRDWKAQHLWCRPEYLKAICGDEMVEIMHDRDSDPAYERNCESHRHRIPFRQYVDSVFSGGKGNDRYLVANNAFFQAGRTKLLLDDIEFFPDYLDERRDGFVHMWFGPANTVTPLHYDTCSIFLAQVMGRKRVTMFNPDQRALLYPSVGVFSEINCEVWSPEKHPLYRYAERQVLILEPGEALFIPVGWWHHVRALDTSISVSMTNFRSSDILTRTF